MIEIRLEAHRDAEHIRRLLNAAFGPERFRKAVYRLREGSLPIRPLCFVAEYHGEIRASLRFWPIEIGGDIENPGTPALLLGPLAVDPPMAGRGLGRALMWHGLARARELGHRIVLLVGDPPYYQPFGFSAKATTELTLPGPVDLPRFMGRALYPGALNGISGQVRPGRWLNRSHDYLAHPESSQMKAKIS